MQLITTHECAHAQRSPFSAHTHNLQEMFEEYASHLLRPGTPSKTFRIKLFVFAAAEEPLTPDEIMDGENFFRSGSWGAEARCACMHSSSTESAILASACTHPAYS